MDNMNTLLANLIQKQKAEIPRLIKAAYIRRNISQRVLSALDTDSIKVIIGPRRSGKSSLALQILRDKSFAYFNFEDEELNFEFSAEEILSCFEQIYPNHRYIFFDEIQLFPKWESLANRLQRLGRNLIITGSNSKLLSSELASSLTGRYIEYQLLPFSFSEYLLALQKQPDIETFVDYLKLGGFPSVVTSRFPAGDFLTSLWDAIILKDLVQRYKIRRIAELKSLLYLILVNMASRASNRSLSRSLNNQLTHSTIAKFIDWAENAYLCCALQNYSAKPRERVNSEKKFYTYDNGFFRAQKISGSDDIGKLLENYVFIELCRHGLSPNLGFFSFQSSTGYEVDFYIPVSSGQATLIQVAYSAVTAKTLNRETRALVHAAKELNVQELYLITCDDSEQDLEVAGFKIRILPAWDGGVAKALNFRRTG